MIALLIAYATLVGGAFTIAALLAERGLQAAGWPTRGVWIVAATGTVLATALLAAVDPARAPAAASLPGATVSGTTVVAASGPDGITVARTQRSEAPSLPKWKGIIARVPFRVSPVVAVAALDRPLGVLWIFGSVTWTALLALSAVGIRRRRKEWRHRVLEDTPVYLSHDVGPAVVGVLRSSIVVPEWVTSLNPSQRGLILRHEREHVRGRDPLLLAVGAGCVALMPVNLALWYLLRRLRAAVEVDCDRRVLVHGTSPQEYGTLLIDIGERILTGTLPDAALAESHSLTRRRILVMTAVRSRFARAQSIALLAVGTIVAVGAVRAPRPDLRVVSPPPALSVAPAVAATKEPIDAPPARPAARPPKPESLRAPARLVPAELSVWPTEARIMIPLPHRDSWEWNLPASADGEVEYAIDVSVASNATTWWAFGFYQWKAPAATRRGDILALLREGAKTLENSSNLTDQWHPALPGSPGYDSAAVAIKERQFLLHVTPFPGATAPARWDPNARCQQCLDRLGRTGRR